MGNTHVVPKAVGCVVPCFIQSLLYHSAQFSSVKLLPLQTAKYRAHLNPPSFPAKEPGRAEHGTQTQSLSQNCFKFSNLSLGLSMMPYKTFIIELLANYVHCRIVHMYMSDHTMHNLHHTCGAHPILIRSYGSLIFTDPPSYPVGRLRMPKLDPSSIPHLSLTVVAQLKSLQNAALHHFGSILTHFESSVYAQLETKQPSQ